jgi:hypothetical protein
LGELAGDCHRFLTKSVLLTGEPGALLTDNGMCCFLDSLRLLVRVCPNVTLSIPRACPGLREAAGTLARRIAFGKEVVLADDGVDFGRYDAILSVGSGVCPDLLWTAINSNGWVARVSSGDQKLPTECDAHNPIGALAAACIGVGEVFKRLIGLRPERGELVNGLSYSLRDYRAVGGSDYGPALPEEMRPDILVVGAGAIGNGLVHLIAQLPFRGQISVVDSQPYGTENLGTCILIGPRDLEKPKAQVLAEQLHLADKDARGFHMPFARFTDEMTEMPAVVVNGLDNIEVRHEVQRLWPDVIVDGAIGDFTCQASRHPWPDDIACLICLFRRPEGERSDKAQSRATGLSIEAVNELGAVVTESDVENAPADKQEFLRLRLGRPICSVIQEAVAIAISVDNQPEGFQPSVPFVAAFSACMVMAETVAHICAWPSALAPRFQFDFLTGPAYGQVLPQRRRADCVCARRKNIGAIRAARKSRRGP